LSVVFSDHFDICEQFVVLDYFSCLLVTVPEKPGTVGELDLGQEHVRDIV